MTFRTAAPGTVRTPLPPHRSGTGTPERGWILATTLAVGLLGCDGGSGAGAPQGETALPVATWTVRAEPVEELRSWAGRLEPLRTLSVQAPREGRVEEVGVRDGDPVAAGQLLVRIVGPDLEARRESAEARHQQLQDELTRWQNLATAGAAGAGEVAEATLRALQAREQLAELDALAESYLIRAPAAGRVYASRVSPGRLVSAGEVLMEVEDRAAWGVRLSVPAWEAGHFEDMERIEVRDDRGTPLTVERVAFASETHPGFVRVDLYLADAEPFRRSAEVRYAAAEDALIVPWTAVAGEGEDYWVARIAPGDPDRVERRPVRLGTAHPGGVEILSGLEAGDRVVRYEPRSHPEGRAVAPIEGNP